MLVSDLLYRASRIAGVLSAAGRGISTSETNDALVALNSMLDSWGTERLLVYGINRQQFPITANKQTYLIGLPVTGSGTWDSTTSTWDENTEPWDSAGYAPDWIAPRPPRIERAGYVYMYSDPPVEAAMKIFTDQEWASVSTKTLCSSLAYSMYYEPTAPLGTVYLWPVPDGTQDIQIALYLWLVIQQFVTAQDVVILPNAYQRAIEYNLAIEIANLYPQRAKLTPLSVQIARESKRQVKNINSPVWLMQCESAARPSRGGHWSSITGHYLPDGYPGV